MQFILLGLLFWLSTVLAGSLDDLLTAIKVDDEAAVANLLRQGMDVNTSDPQGNSLLAIAAREGSSKAFKTLLERDPRLDAQNRFGETALMLAAYNGREEMVENLLASKARVNQPGWNALIYAAAKGETRIVRRLLQAGADINAVSPNGTSALMMAARAGYKETVLMLVGNDAMLNLKNERGGTALGWAMDAGNSDIAELLIKAGAE